VIIGRNLDKIRCQDLTGGQVFDERPASQHAVVVDDPADALFRVSVEPGGPGTDQREIVLWLSAWGDQGQRVDELGQMGGGA
jgi:hypothetical protein